jgi:hypothetical protein
MHAARAWRISRINKYIPSTHAIQNRQVLEALAEIAFAPQFLPTRVEKERKAVLAEAQVGGGAALSVSWVAAGRVQRLLSGMQRSMCSSPAEPTNQSNHQPAQPTANHHC